MRRGISSAVAIVAVAAISMTAVLATRHGEQAPRPAQETRASDLVLLVVRTPPGPLAAVIGTAGATTPAGVAIPGGLLITIPGQGEGKAADVLTSGPSGAVAVSNLLGTWVDHRGTTDLQHLAAVVDRAGGIEVSGIARTGTQVSASLRRKGPGQLLQWQQVLAGLLASRARWEPGDFTDADSVEDVSRLLETAGPLTVGVLPTKVSAGGIEEPDYDAIAELMLSTFGAPARDVIPVIVLNGSGTPGVGEGVAGAIVPGGFRVVLSGNASSFDHAETLIVVGGSGDPAIAERVRDLLGVGRVTVSGPASGIADVTVIVGKDFRTA